MDVGSGGERDNTQFLHILKQTILHFQKVSTRCLFYRLAHSNKRIGLIYAGVSLRDLQFIHQIALHMETENRVEVNDSDNAENQVITYNAPWNIFALGFSNKPQYPFRLGIGSFLPDFNNEVQIIQLNQSKNLIKRTSFPHEYPPTKLMFIPDETGNKPDLMATSGECLKIWKIKDNSQASLQLNLKNDNDFSAPLTSFDWNPELNNLIGTSSIDTTCTIWDIEKSTVFTQLIAHDKEVYDIHFSKERNIFASVGADGSVRQFDIRDLQHSSVQYETQRGRPILKLAWNRKQPNTTLLACIQMQANYVTMIDSRKPVIPVMRLSNHKDCVNALAWAPQSAVHMCTVGDDSKAYIWDLTTGNTRSQFQTPLLQYKADDQISNLAWSSIQKEWLSICYANQLQMLRL